MEAAKYDSFVLIQVVEQGIREPWQERSACRSIQDRLAFGVTFNQAQSGGHGVHESLSGLHPSTLVPEPGLCQIGFGIWGKPDVHR